VSGQTQMVTGARRAQGAPSAGRPLRAPAPAGRPAGTRAGTVAAPVRGRPGVRTGPPRTRPPRTGPTGPPRVRADAPQRRPDVAAGGAVRSSRTPFVFLVVGLLGGGLLCLLLINTILDTGSYQITQLQQENIALVQRTQELQAQIAHEESPAVLASRAHRLGMREPSLLYFLDLRKGRIDREPAHMPGIPAVPGYSP
jgi:cell division protein FtsB